MQILIGYSCGRSNLSTKTQYENWARRLNESGLQVDLFCLTLNPPGERLSWPEIHRKWKLGDIDLLSLYEDLVKVIDKYDVFLNYNGINLHPEFVEQLPTFNVFSCFDDPESSDDLSKPAAYAYDLAMVGNIAEVKTYKSWGVENVHWWPLGFRHDDFNPQLTREEIINGKRDIEVTLLCERLTHYRRRKLDEFNHAFPRGTYYGRGWPNGFLPEAERVPLLQRTKIGINIHNSTGPINFRTFYLPANGILQICDNKTHLGKIYELGKEVIGYDSIEEAIELVHFYLAHDDKRREIAAAGWERATRDYNEKASFLFMVEAVNALKTNIKNGNNDILLVIQKQQTEAAALNGYCYLKIIAEALYIKGKRRFKSGVLILRNLVYSLLSRLKKYSLKRII